MPICLTSTTDMDVAVETCIIQQTYLACKVFLHPSVTATRTTERAVSQLEVIDGEAFIRQAQEMQPAPVCLSLPSASYGLSVLHSNTAICHGTQLTPNWLIYWRSNSTAWRCYYGLLQQLKGKCILTYHPKSHGLLCMSQNAPADLAYYLYNMREKSWNWKISQNHWPRWARKARAIPGNERQQRPSGPISRLWNDDFHTTSSAKPCSFRRSSNNFQYFTTKFHT